MTVNLPQSTQPERSDPAAPDSPAAAGPPWSALLLVAGAASLLWGSTVAGEVGPEHPVLRTARVAGTVGACGIAFAALVVPSERGRRRLEWGLLLLALLVLAQWVACRLLLPGAHTDEGALTAEAARRLLAGQDPYPLDLTYALHTYHVLPGLSTPLLDGTLVGRYSYPALPVLATSWLIPLADGWGVDPVLLLQGVALGCTLLLTHLLLPPGRRGLAALLVVGLPAGVEFGMDGLLELLALPGLLLAAWRWDRTGADCGRAGSRYGRLGWAGAARAAGLGVALSAHQLAWFAAPFAVLGVFLQNRPRAGAGWTAVRYAAVAVGVFLAFDLPFLVDDPGSWLSGVLLPLTQKAVPFGNSVVDLPAVLGSGIGDLRLYGLAAGCALIASMALLVLHFERLRPALFVLPVLPFLFAARSLEVYFTQLVPVWAVGLLSTGAVVASAARPRGRVRRLATGLLVGCPLAAVAVALAVPGPLRPQITGWRTAVAPSGTGYLGEVELSVRNTGGSALRPHFMTANRRLRTSPEWRVLSGPAVLRPHRAAVYRLAAGDELMAPRVGPGQAFSIEVVTSDPDTVTWSPVARTDRPF
jgi:hypothetical protein